MTSAPAGICDQHHRVCISCAFVQCELLRPPPVSKRRGHSLSAQARTDIASPDSTLAQLHWLSQHAALSQHLQMYITASAKPTELSQEQSSMLLSAKQERETIVYGKGIRGSTRSRYASHRASYLHLSQRQSLTIADMLSTCSSSDVSRPSVQSFGRTGGCRL